MGQFFGGKKGGHPGDDTAGANGTGHCNQKLRGVGKIDSHHIICSKTIFCQICRKPDGKIVQILKGGSTPQKVECRSFRILG